MLLDLGLEPLQDRWDLLKLCWHRKLYRMREDREDGQPHRFPAVMADYTAAFRYQGSKLHGLFVHDVLDVWRSLPSALEHDWGSRDCAHRHTLFDDSHTAFQTRMKCQLWKRTLDSFVSSVAGKPRLHLFAKTIASVPLDKVPSRRVMRPYLRFSRLESGCCLQFLFRAGTVHLRSVAHDFTGRLRADSPMCPCCGAAQETAQHVLVQCAKYQADRQKLLQYFRLVHSKAFAQWLELGVEEQAAWLLDDQVWGKGKPSTTATLPEDALSQLFAPHWHVQEFLLRLWKTRESVIDCGTGTA